MPGCLFCDFVSGRRKKNKNGFPFIPVNESRHTLAFLSIDKVKDHLLIIPKNHFKNFEDVEPSILSDLSRQLVMAGKIIQKEYPGYNLLLNNGRAAGQFIPHAHFHVIPRNRKSQKKLFSEKRFIERSYWWKKEFAAGK